MIPTAGRWDALRRTLDALGAQPLAIEVVVVVDGLDIAVPGDLSARAGVRIDAIAKAGPAAARNHGARLAAGSLLLFLGDDTIPQPELIARHVFRHKQEPDPEVAVLGRVRWHPAVARRRVNRWLEWSGTQFDYDQIAREDPVDVGFGRFYTANVSLKRSLFEAVGGFDTAFQTAAYEDIDFGYRAAQQGMRLRYEPEAVALHLHPYSLATAQRRFEAVGAAERVMAAKHDWFTPWYHERFSRHGSEPPVSRLWPLIADYVPENFERLWWPARERADRWYHQQFAATFLAGWDRQREVEELQLYLGDRYALDRLRGHTLAVEREAAEVADEQRFYRTSEAYLYDLTVFAMSGTKDPYRRLLRQLVTPGGRVLDYGCGIGSDGLRLLEQGYEVEFADFDNPSARYLRWRLAHRGLRATVHDIDAGVPGGFDAAYAFDVIEHVEDPFAFLAELESRAALVMVNLLEPVPEDLSVHHELPIPEIIAHAQRRGLKLRRRLHGRSILIAYRGS